jgi:DEAD/DEAH box helicase domain-containing protein
VGTECPSPLQRRARPLRFIIYDAKAGGLGICAAAFALARPVLAAALEMVAACGCDDGCPACVHDTACREFNHVIDKQACAIILRAALGELHDVVGGAEAQVEAPWAAGRPGASGLAASAPRAGAPRQQYRLAGKLSELASHEHSSAHE